MIERRCRMRRLQDYMSSGLMMDYALVMLAVSFAISYMVSEGCVASMLLAKFVAFSIVGGLWSLMAYSFLQAKFSTGTIVMTAAVTLFAVINIITLFTMDYGKFTMNIEVLVAAMMATALITGILMVINKIMEYVHKRDEPHTR